MNYRFLFILILALGLPSVSCTSNSDKSTLNILTYSSFQSPFGPAPTIFKSFEKKCNCKVKAINAGDALMIKQKLKFESEKVDLIIGLDQFLVFELEPEKYFSRISSKVNFDPIIPKLGKKHHEYYLPYDWAPLTFLKRTEQKKYPKKLKDLFAEEYKKSVIVSDAAFSSPGKHFLFWFSQENSKFTESRLKSFKNSIFKIAPSWTSSYGLFQKGNADYIFSYITSPMYHKLVEKKELVEPMFFEDVSSYPVQVEYVALNKNSKKAVLAKQFIDHLLEDESQNTLMNKNFMFSVKKDVIQKSEFNQIYKKALKIKSLDYSLYYDNQDLLRTYWLNFKK
ncbi:thiamine ABC transporter substrate-binding protein [bacterium]|nr:thiamine ABC transporter substrate-binding protein [bacterium]